jgi:outer membrane protein TolC
VIGKYEIETNLSTGMPVKPEIQRGSKMEMKQNYRALFLTAIVVGLLRPAEFSVFAADKLDPSLIRVEQRLEEETKMDPAEPNSIIYLRAIGERPTRSISPRKMIGKRTLTLEECLQLAFISNNEVRQARQQILAVGGSKLITNSRFLPTIELISRYEHFRNLGTDNVTDDTHDISATITQRILEFGKDNPLDLTLRDEQRRALFAYESRIARVFSDVRKAFFFVKLKEQQIVTRQKLLDQFQRQYEIKQERMDANNLSTKFEVLTARTDMLNEQIALNALESERFNSKIDLLRLIGLPVGADHVEFEGQMDRFGLDDFDMDGMVRLALAQSSDVAIAEAELAEQQRLLDQLRFEYTPDMRFRGGYQTENGKIGAGFFNDDDTWGLEIEGQPKVPGLKERNTRNLGLFGNEISLSGPDPGWFVGLQLRIPITEGRAREGRRIRARAILASFKAALEDRKDEIELAVRQNYKLLTEQEFQVKLAQTKVNISYERFVIKTELRDVGKINDDELETYRRFFFNAQDIFLIEQVNLINRQEDLRFVIRYFK